MKKILKLEQNWINNSNRNHVNMINHENNGNLLNESNLYDKDNNNQDYEGKLD